MTAISESGFNLLDEPWVPVLDRAGIVRELSLTETIGQARSVRTIGGDVSTQSFVLLRLCLAVLHRALAKFTPTSADDVPRAVEALVANWDNRVLPEVQAYLDRHRERFDLFHPTEPFFQTPGLRTAKGDYSDLSKIVVDVPNGAPYLTMRSARSLRSISAAEAARWLVHAQAYDTSGIKTGVVGHPRAKGGKVYPEGVAWTGQLGGIHLRGENLMHTLMLHLWAALPEDDEALASDLPPWERPVPRVEGLPARVDALGPSRPAGPVDLFTWQPRQILLREDRGGVTGVLITYADRFLLQQRQDLIRREPLTLWRYSKPQTAKYKQRIQMTRKHQPGSALWRGLANIIHDHAPNDEERPARSQILAHVAELRNSSLLEHGLVHLRAISVEYGSQESVIDEIVEDSLDLPAAVLDPDQLELRKVALDAVEAASSGVDALRFLAANVAAAAGASGSSLEGPRNMARETGYAALDPKYRTWLRTSLLQYEDDPSRAVGAWHQVAWRTLRGLGEEIVANAPDRAWKGYGASGARIDVGRADAMFGNALLKALPLAFGTDSKTTKEVSR
ncbi:type I-E CRISPR-associated protein Cse1/CasA [Pseudactinotalea sp. Z1732]|uniref:type I-E CRISPR-associated protein Cse1/CasA n=1 Tax=Micrococcales TaxID=85006 RepID=UPI003C7DC47E